MEQPPEDHRAEPSARATATPTLVNGAIIVLALYYGQELLVPLVLASLLAFVLAPACNLLQHLRVPRALAVVLVVLATFALLAGIGDLVGHQVAALASEIPKYKVTILSKWHAVLAEVSRIQAETKLLGSAGSDAAEGAASLTNKSVTAMFGTDLSGLSMAKMIAVPILGPLGTAAVTLIFTLFILASDQDLRDRLVRLFGRQDLYRTILAMNDASRRLSRYYLFQIALNSSFGLVVGGLLALFGLPHALLWGILCAILRFIPFIGVIVAALPPILLATAVVPGWSLAIAVAILFIVAETIMGQVVEPLVYGHHTGVSPMAVIVATAFWALLWGPIGLLIATPLTVCLVVIGRRVESLSFLDVLFGDEAPLRLNETFYQRALEARGAALLPSARKLIAASSLTDYLDNVALPGLALAQDDLARDELSFERLDTIHQEIEAVLVRLRTLAKAGAAPQTDRRPAGSSWDRSGSIICIAGRGQLDDLAADMSVIALEEAGFGARTEPNRILGSQTPVPSLQGARLCCLSVLENGSSAAAVRYFIKRLQRQVPDAIIVVGLWHASRESSLLTTLRAEGGREHLVRSIGELIAFTQATAARDQTAQIEKQADSEHGRVAVTSHSRTPAL